MCLLKTGAYKFVCLEATIRAKSDKLVNYYNFQIQKLSRYLYIK